MQIFRHATKDTKLMEGQTLKVAHHCFISRLGSLSALFSIRLSHLAPLCLLYIVFFLRYSLSSIAFIYVRLIQMAKVNFAITKYLARKSLRYGATNHFGAAATIQREKLPLDFHGEITERTSRPRRAPGTYFAELTRARY